MAPSALPADSLAAAHPEEFPVNDAPPLSPRRNPDRSPRWQHVCGWIVVASAWFLSSAAASPIVTGIHRTGLVAEPSSLLRSITIDIDPFWRVVALPETLPFPPYEASLFSGRGPSFSVPAAWYHGADGIDGAGWIGLRPETTNSLYPQNVGAQPDYTVIYATTFTASESGLALFDLTATADNEVSFFVNGGVVGGMTLNPAIIGGTQIGVAQRGLNRLHDFQGYSAVLAGENTLYAVVRDFYTLDPLTNIGGYGQTGLLVAFVPEPAAWASLLAGAVCLLIGARWRRARRPRRRRGVLRPNGASLTVECTRV